jgi:hypothetical protein
MLDKTMLDETMLDEMGQCRIGYTGKTCWTFT